MNDADTCCHALIIDQQYDSLFRFFMSCAYAEFHALGFDPTVVLVEVPGSPLQYDITVASGTPEQQVYRTAGVLADPGSQYVVGRGTRVWKARRLDTQTGEVVGEPVALKDAWVDSHREREGDINQRIRTSAASLPDVNRARLEQLLLTVVCHGDVIIDGVQDRTRPCTDRNPATGLHDSSPKRIKHQHPAPLQVAQTHYRIVFREVGKSLREESSLPVVFSALADTCEGKL